MLAGLALWLGTVARWHEGPDWDCRLSCQAGDSLRLAISVQSGTITWSSVREDKVTGGKCALAIPIRVAGCKRPQVLAEVYRPNWLVFQIYAVRGDVADLNVASAFGFSCRDEGSIAWHSRKGRLVSFDTYDRYERVPASLERRHVVGHPWELVTHYRFDPRAEKWVAGRRHWKRYLFDSDGEGQQIAKASDCRFLFK